VPEQQRQCGLVVGLPIRPTRGTARRPICVSDPGIGRRRRSQVHTRWNRRVRRYG
jgi:hypothetical protein